MLDCLKEPILFQGRNKSKKYFEGWYFKQVSADLKHSISVIPGISKDTCDSHAFIQTIINSGNFQETHYHRFLPEEFLVSDNPFLLKIGNNTFSKSGMTLDLSDDTYSLRGNITFSEFTKIKTSTLCPTIMGFFNYIPFMECYHGIVSMNHCICGTLKLNQGKLGFEGGKGYIEKDWGTSFPKKYCWLQSNSFEHPEASIMCSVADIPFLGFSFRGFLCNLTLGGQEYRFASYNHSKLVKIECVSHKSILINLVKKDLQLEIFAEMQESGILKAPKNGSMSHSIKEGLNGRVKVRLTKKTGELLFYGTGIPCGIELMNS